MTSTGTPSVVASYLSGPSGVVTNPGEPTLPLLTSNVSVAGQVLRGVGFRGATFTDTPGVTPLTGAPATELNAPHAPFVSAAFFPARLWTLNYFGGLADNPTTTRLNLTPAQYRSDAPGSTTDVLRRYTNTSLRLFYSSNTQAYAADGGGTNRPGWPRRRRSRASTPASSTTRSRSPSASSAIRRRASRARGSRTRASRRARGRRSTSRRARPTRASGAGR